ncbi:hypothetical protein [Marinobacter litoralis]|uniref:hypothetical protein n=1 Tax=Marinobacter litoralis TaxID=187981 RepID=UPI0018EE3768|nr:hypothetical protein [Marinobacter litoralis]MBJ6136987.1 hypothetical protein [Marinobacter litoralis]
MVDRIISSTTRKYSLLICMVLIVQGCASLSCTVDDERKEGPFVAWEDEVEIDWETKQAKNEWRGERQPWKGFMEGFRITSAKIDNNILRLRPEYHTEVKQIRYSIRRWNKTCGVVFPEIEKMEVFEVEETGNVRVDPVRKFSDGDGMFLYGKYFTANSDSVFIKHRTYVEVESGEVAFDLGEHFRNEHNKPVPAITGIRVRLEYAPDLKRDSSYHLPHMIKGGVTEYYEDHSRRLLAGFSLKDEERVSYQYDKHLEIIQRDLGRRNFRKSTSNLESLYEFLGEENLNIPKKYHFLKALVYLRLEEFELAEKSLQDYIDNGDFEYFYYAKALLKKIRGKSPDPASRGD